MFQLKQTDLYTMQQMSQKDSFDWRSIFKPLRYTKDLKEAYKAMPAGKEKTKLI